jgi:penicillin-binding protein 1C
VTGAGPLLHRAVLVTAQRYAPGDLVRPPEAGLVSASICRVSGLLATRDCPAMTEWFKPGTVPTARCHWHENGEVHLPVQYAEWEATGRSDRMGSPPPGGAPVERPRHPATVEPFRITSPAHGDRYQIPPGVAPEFATIALRASGGSGRGPLRWFADGRPVTTNRWQLTPGTHQLRAVVGSESDEVTVTVDR